MDRLASIWDRLRGVQRSFGRGQTMAEYAFILAAIAIVVFVSYVAMGQDVNALISWKSIDDALLGAM